MSNTPSNSPSQSQPPQERKQVRCPHCDLMNRVPLTLSNADTSISKGIGQFIENAFHGANAKQLAASNDWVDMTCKHCGSEFRYNRRSGEVKA